jgi:hypothetical protein
MANVRLFSIIPSAPPPSSMTDQEVINMTLTRYPRLGPLLGVVMQRYQELTDKINGKVSFPDFHGEKIECPHCGGALIMHTDQPDLTNGT